MRRGLTAVAAALAAVLLGAQPGLGALPAPPAAGSSAAEPELCVAAARAAARRHGIPPGVMQAITLVETRRRTGGVTGPWPWTLNVEGEGRWFATRAEALGDALRELGRGRRSIDLGCFQLNWRWHGQNFATPDGMLDPALSADYAARFLAGLHAETGDWMRAVGHYHSRTPAHAARYRDLIGRALARLDEKPDWAPVAASEAAATGPVADREGVRAGPRRAEPASAPPPPARREAVARAAHPVPLIALGVGREVEPAGTARAAGGVDLRVFARAASSWFGGADDLSVRLPGGISWGLR